MVGVARACMSRIFSAVRSHPGAVHIHLPGPVCLVAVSAHLIVISEMRALPWLGGHGRPCAADARRTEPSPCRTPRSGGFSGRLLFLGIDTKAMAVHN